MTSGLGHLSRSRGCPSEFKTTGNYEHSTLRESLTTGRRFPPTAIRYSDGIILQYRVTEYCRRDGLQSPAKLLKLQFPLSFTRGVDIADITSFEEFATGLKYLPFSEIPDLSVFIVNCVLAELSTSLSVSIIITQHSLGPERQTDAVFTSHTPKVFARLTSTLQNVNYFLAGSVDDGGQIERQTGLQYGVLQHPRELLPLL
jgi:hypothetical protein